VRSTQSINAGGSSISGCHRCRFQHRTPPDRAPAHESEEDHWNLKYDRSESRIAEGWTAIWASDSCVRWDCTVSEYVGRESLGERKSRRCGAEKRVAELSQEPEGGKDQSNRQPPGGPRQEQYCQNDVDRNYSLKICQCPAGHISVKCDNGCVRDYR